MPIVRMDEKGRIQLPQALRDRWRLKPRQALVVEASGDTIAVRKAKKLDPKTDPLLRDIFIQPARTKFKVTSKLLRKIKDEQWSA